MEPSRPVLTHLSLVTAIGTSSEQVWSNLFTDPDPGLLEHSELLNRNVSVPLGLVDREFEPLPSEHDEYDCRNNRIARFLLDKLDPGLESLREKYGPGNIGVVVGTSTSGLRSGEQSIDNWLQGGEVTEDFDYSQFEMGGLGQFIARYSGLYGPTVTISTSCSSSGKVFQTGVQYLRMGLVDAVVVGGIDTLSAMTLNGFDSLQLVSEEPSNPFSVNREGINIGEGGALFLLELGTGGVEVMGVGESSDSYQMNAPDPEGVGAELSMQRALDQAELSPEDVDYLNFHGTGTNQNDAMESKAVSRVFDGEPPPASSTKPFTGHTLGAAGAIEAAFCYLSLNRTPGEGTLACLPHLWDGEPDPDLPEMNLADGTETIDPSGSPVVMSNSFAFGGNNCTVVLGQQTDG